MAADQRAHSIAPAHMLSLFVQLDTLANAAKTKAIDVPAVCVVLCVSCLLTPEIISAVYITSTVRAYEAHVDICVPRRKSFRGKASK